MGNKPVRYLFVFIIAVLCSLLALSFNIQEMCVETVSKVKIENNITGNISDTIFDYTSGVTNDQLMDYQNTIAKSNNLKKINDAYISDGVEYILHGGTLNPDVSEEYNDFLNECIDEAQSEFNISFSADKKNEIKKKLKKVLNFHTLYTRVINRINKSMSSKIRLLLQVYQFSTSILCKAILALWLIVCIFIETRLHNSKNYFVNDICKGLILSSLILLIFMIFLNQVSTTATLSFIGSSTSIYTDGLIKYSLIQLIIGCIGTIGTYIYMDKYWKKEK
ncbi:MAG: hypothetical protein PHH04_04470 [Thomasclavelia sp.]|nr:hypothetical protein [Thomasclavelia sp.]